MQKWGVKLYKSPNEGEPLKTMGADADPSSGCKCHILMKLHRATKYAKKGGLQRGLMPMTPQVTCLVGAALP